MDERLAPETKAVESYKYFTVSGTFSFFYEN